MPYGFNNDKSKYDMSGLLYVAKKQYTIPANSSNVVVDAPTVSGYTFLCWLPTATAGNVNASYINDQTASHATVWVATSAGMSNARNVVVAALYVKNM